MEDYVVVTRNLTKRFGEKTAVKGLDLNIRRGEIYGFVGKNGAGKTTAMKLILSLLSPDDGEIYLFGEKPSKNALKKVGSLIEEPGLYGDATAYENMKRFSILSGGSEQEINELLSLVGLGDVGKKKVKAFSLGMKQRLGIAVALIGDPEFLVLDEPINGLDPQGIKEVRDILLKVNRERNTTILISSHILSELEKIATTYGIINDGVLVEEVSSLSIEDSPKGSLEIGCSDPKKAAKIIKDEYGADCEITATGITVKGLNEIAAKINRTLVFGDVDVTSIKHSGSDAESFFIEKTGGLSK